MLKQSPFHGQSFDSLIDQMNSLFFNHNSNYKEFIERSPSELMSMPFYDFNNKILYYGGDYIIVNDSDNSNNYIFYFVIPGHDDSTIEVNRNGNKLTIKSKDVKENKNTMKNPFKEGSPYNFYKTVNLVKSSYEVKEAICKNGILSIIINDTEKTAKPQEIEVKNTYS
jgi:HSP20 family molecular chaperone IbpA